MEMSENKLAETVRRAGYAYQPPEPRYREMLEMGHRARRRRMAVASLSVMVIAAMAGVGLNLLGNEGSSGVDVASGGSSLTRHELDVATAVAHAELAHLHGKLRSATATVSTGSLPESNTGHECHSGRVIRIKLIGQFDLAVAGDPAQMDKAGKWQASELAVDPSTSEICLSSVELGRHVKPAPGATFLFGPKGANSAN